MNCRSRHEEKYNSLSHLVLAIASLLFLFNTTYSFEVFFFFSFITFFSSYLYHSVDSFKYKLFFRQCDIASIYWLIAATIYDLLPAYFGVGFLSLTILMSFPTLTMKMGDLYSDVALITLAIAAFLLPVIVGNFRITSLIGLSFYAMGLPFYFAGDKPWRHTIWHVFVCIGWCVYAFGKINYGFA